MSELIFNTRQSLIDQSLHSRLGVEVTNGDGFGIGWFGSLASPGMYKSVQPAWNDSNLHDLCDHLSSGLFMAHIRASTGTPVQFTNCHPFRCGQWLFVHNGSIREFPRLRRRMLQELDDENFGHVGGGTDSELMFMLAMQFGLEEDVKQGIERMIGFVESIGREAGVECPMQMTLGIADGRRLYTARYSTGGDSRSLYLSRHLGAIEEQLEPRQADLLEKMGPNARCIVSEPLSDLESLWEPVSESSFITVDDGEILVEKLSPTRP